VRGEMYKEAKKRGEVTKMGGEKGNEPGQEKTWKNKGHYRRSTTQKNNFPKSGSFSNLGEVKSNPTWEQRVSASRKEYLPPGKNRCT